jgi:hypothetical protein
MIKKVKIINSLVAGVMVFSSIAYASNDVPVKVAVQEAYGKLPLYFIQNDGQLDKKVKFYEKGNGHATFFTKDGFYLSLIRGEENGSRPDVNVHKEVNSGARVQTESVKLAPLGANKNVEVVAEEMLDGKINYLTGNNPDKWKTNIPTYKAVVYKEVYKGIDMKFYGNNSQLEYDIIVNPGADPGNVRLSYDGIKGLKVTGDGDLAISLTGGDIIQKRPVVYQEIDGKRVDVAGRFKILKQHSKQETAQFAYGFEVGAYNKNHPLIIDPVLSYSTYLSGTGVDTAYDITVDASGNAYISGYTDSIDFPLASPLYGSHAGSGDAFVTKINATGRRMLYSTYLGGTGNDHGKSIAVDTLSNIYIRGITLTAVDTRYSILVYGGLSEDTTGI